MGVQGLWQLLESTGRPVTLESLEGKVLAVDVSLWLHQAIRGMRDEEGNVSTNAHLQVLFNRICKLLFYRIKPVFVFDGAAPQLKKQTIVARRQRRERASSNLKTAVNKVLKNYLKTHALKAVVGCACELPEPPTRVPLNRGSSSQEPDLFQLPPMPESADAEQNEEDSSEQPEDTWAESQEQFVDFAPEEDMGATDIDSDVFKALPLEVQHELITVMKEKGKRSSWKKLSQLPQDAGDFSSYQLSKLLTKGKMTQRLDKIRQEMKVRNTGAVASFLDYETNIDELQAGRIMSEDTEHYVLVKNKPSVKMEDEASSSNASQGASSSSAELHDERVEGTMKSGSGVKRSQNSSNASRDVDLSRGDSSPVPVEKSKEISNAVKSFFAKDTLQVDTGSNIEGQRSESTESGSKVRTTSESESKDNDLEIISNSEPSEAPSTDNVQIIDTKPGKRNPNMQSFFSTALDQMIFSELKSPKEGQQSGDTTASDKAGASKSLNTEDKAESVQSDDIMIVDEVKGSSTGMPKQSPTTLSKGGMPGPFPFMAAMMDKLIASALSDNLEVKNDVLSGKAASLSKETEAEKKQPETVDISDDDSDDDFIEVADPSTDEPKPKEPTTSEPETNKEPLLQEDTNIIYEDQKPEPTPSMLESNKDPVSEESTPSLLEAKEASESPLLNKDTDIITEDSKPEEPTPVIVEEINSSESSHQGTNIITDEPKPETSTPVMLEKVDESPRKEMDVEADVINLEEEGDNNEKQSKDHDAEDKEMKSVVEAERTSEKDEKSDDETSDHVMETSTNEETQEVQAEDAIQEWAGHNVENPSQLQEDLESERLMLTTERHKQERVAVSITDVMYAESKELLQLFGIPFIVSPQEAEAQCAHLDETKQTQGTITDDSDIWLFGGCFVYKNFFAKDKNVEFFRKTDLEKQLVLTRDKLIQLAYLLGSDYTVGVQGVGCVTAMELLSEFPGQALEGLTKFKEWWDSAQKQLMPPVESVVKGKLRKITAISPGFPNPVVREAYVQPVVDESKEKFSWGSPDLDLLREFATLKFGWSRKKIDEKLLPVLRKLNDKQIQSKINHYFPSERTEEKTVLLTRSKRLQRVLKKFRNSGADEEEDAKAKKKADVPKRPKSEDSEDEDFKVLHATKKSCQEANEGHDVRKSDRVSRKVIPSLGEKKKKKKSKKEDKERGETNARDDVEIIDSSGNAGSKSCRVSRKVIPSLVKQKKRKKEDEEEDEDDYMDIFESSEKSGSSSDDSAEKDANFEVLPGFKKSCQEAIDGQRVRRSGRVSQKAIPVQGKGNKNKKRKKDEVEAASARDDDAKIIGSGNAASNGAKGKSVNHVGRGNGERRGKGRVGVKGKGKLLAKKSRGNVRTLRSASGPQLSESSSDSD